MKFNELGRSFFRKKLQIRSNFVTTCTTKGTRGAKSPVDATFSGRSMVEMLGVLAIIGVLSVGALSGYSRAIFKYKINKQAEQVYQLIANTYQYFTQVKSLSANTGSSLIPFLEKMNLIPDGLKRVTTSLYDSLDTQISVYQSPGDNSITYFAFVLSSTLSKDKSSATQSCFNLAQIAKDYAINQESNFYMLTISTAQNNTTSNRYAYYGTRTVSNCSSVKCLKNISDNELMQACGQIADVRSSNENIHISITVFY